MVFYGVFGSLNEYRWIHEKKVKKWITKRLAKVRDSRTASLKSYPRSKLSNMRNNQIWIDVLYETNRGNSKSGLIYGVSWNKYMKWWNTVFSISTNSNYTKLISVSDKLCFLRFCLFIWFKTKKLIDIGFHVFVPWKPTQ